MTSPLTPAIHPGQMAVACALGLSAACSGSTAAAGEVPGESLYAQHCLFCHGVDRQGVGELGVDLLASEFVRSKSPDELVDFLKAGRTPESPASVTGRPMPGFDWLTDSDLRALAEYIGSQR